MKRLVMIYDFNFAIEQSSLIKKIFYNVETEELYVEFHTWLEVETYEKVPIELIADFLDAKSKGKFFLNNIKNRFKTKNENAMADKIIKLKIDVTKLKKEWFFKGEKGVYADITLLYSEKQDQYGANGMITQDVPKAIYQKDKSVRGPILGNAKDWATEARDKEATPGVEAGKMAETAEEFEDDLPF